MILKNEFKRKSLHLLLIFIPIAFCFLGKKMFLSIIIPVSAIVVLADYCRRKNHKIQELFIRLFAKILRPHELINNNLCGASYVAISSSITFSLFPKEIAITGFVILVISDTLASLVGKSIPSQPFFEKSIAGSMAFMLSSISIVFLFGWYFKMDFLFYFFGVISALFTTGLEARPSIMSIDDNFTIPIGFGLMMTFFNLMWNFI